VFGDGNTISLDLCQHCVREVLGQWLRIEPPVDAGGPAAFTQALMRMPNVGKDADFARHPGLERSAEFGSESRDEHEQAARSGEKPLKGIIRKPVKPVSVEGMNAATAEQAGRAGDAQLQRKRKKPQQRK
jgi:hypothetical protein